MGCFPSSYNQISTEYTFNNKDFVHLTHSWILIKSHDHLKFAQDVLIRTSNENLAFRQYWRTKIQVEGNNYDYGEHDSCLRSDSSWHVGLRDYSPRFIALFDQLLTLMKEPNQVFNYLQLMSTSESLFLVDYQSLLVLKRCMLDLLHERWKTVDYNSNEIYEKVWEKFLTFIIDYVTKLKKNNETPTELMSLGASPKE